MSSFLSWLGGGSQAGQYNNLGNGPGAAALQYTASTMTPAQMQAAQQGANALAGATGDAGAQSAENSALQQDQAESKNGMTAADQTAENQALQASQRATNGTLGAIAQHAAETGQAGGGGGLAQALMAAQTGADSNSDAGSNAATGAQSRMLSANSAAGNLAGNINAQKLGAQQAIGSAQNAINASNTNATNQAGALNMQGQNSAAANNQAAYNSANQWNANANNQAFQDQESIDAAKAGANQSANSAGLGMLGSIAAGAGAAAKAEGGEIESKDFRDGGAIPGKAKVEGDSYANDTVPIVASPGEIMVPRSAVAGGLHTMMDFLKGELKKRGDK